MRPVSLTSVVVKLIGKIIQVAILDYVKGYTLLFRQQHRFEKGLSCLAVPLIATEDWAAAKDRNIPVDVISIDPSRAFDKVSRLGAMSTWRFVRNGVLASSMRQIF
ncbi:unnamed protein product [Schistosoma bovis]|nr:unnamed protein product [Schistosoma bovis]